MKNRKISGQMTFTCSQDKQSNLFIFKLTTNVKGNDRMEFLKSKPGMNHEIFSIHSTSEQQKSDKSKQRGLYTTL